MSKVVNLEHSTKSYQTKTTLEESLDEFERDLLARFSGAKNMERVRFSALVFAREAIGFWLDVGWIPFDPIIEVREITIDDKVGFRITADRVPLRLWIEAQARKRHENIRTRIGSDEG